MSSLIFSGLVFSCTGIEPAERETIRKRVECLGGQYTGHLTRKVTHLVAAKIIRSEKYKSAKEILRIPVVLPSFVDDCWTRSRLGGVDIKHMESLHAVPPLFGCQVSVSGVSMEERRSISEMVQQLGGTYCSDLNKLCTHLISCKSVVSARSLGPKLQFALKWSIPVVEYSWLMACQQSSMYVDERAHVLQIEAGSGAVISSQAYTDVTLEDVAQCKEVPPYLDGCHIYLGDGLDDSRLALLKKLILVAGGTRYSDHYHGDITHFIVHNQMLSTREMEQLKRYPNQPIVVHDQWLLACFVAKARLDPELYQIDPALIYKAMRTSNLPETSQATTLGGLSQAKSNVWATKQRPSQQPAEPSMNPPQHWMVPHRKTTQESHVALDTPPDSASRPSNVGRLFEGLKLFLHPDLQNQYADRVTRKLGGLLVARQGDADYQIYPLHCHLEGGLANPDKSKCVNEVWMLGCLSEGRLLAPDDQPFFSPILSRRPVDKGDFRSVNVCATGYVGLERDYYARLTTELGGFFSEALSKRNTHLICKSTGPFTGPKIDFARQVGIHCITEEWLLACAMEGCVLPPEKFRLGLPSVSPKRPRTACPEVDDKENEQPDTPLTKRHKVESSQKTPASKLRRDFFARLKNDKKDQPGVHDAPPTPVSSPIAGNSTLLNGLTFSISRRLWHRRDELHSLVSDLGGAFVWSFDQSCTHFLHQGNQKEESFRDFRVARHCGKHIVSPWWLLHCKKEGKLVDEALYPHNYTPTDPTKHEPQTRPIEAAVPPEPLIVPEATPVEVPEDFHLELSTPHCRRKAPNVVTYAGVDSPLVETAEEPSSLAPPSSRPSSTQSLTVNTQGLTLDSEEVTLKHIMLSGLAPAEKTDCARILKDFGCVISPISDRWDSEATHLITGTATLSEKYLAACAAGIWVLRPDYATACEKAGKLLPEADYEWQPAWNDSTSDGSLKAAPRSWRKYLSSPSKLGAFQDWTVMLAVDQKRLPGFVRILKAGHANVFTIPDIGNEGTPQPVCICQF